MSEAVDVWAAGLPELRPEPGEELDEAVLRGARRLAGEEEQCSARRRELAVSRAALEAEQSDLHADLDAPPPLAPWRDADQPGAPLWRLCDFAGGLSDRERAGLERALEASGLLDARLEDGALRSGHLVIEGVQHRHFNTAKAGEVDPITLDIIENALRHARFEMDAVLFRSAMSPVIREQHDEFPMLTDPQGRMVVGQFGAYINEMMENWDRGIYPGDVILTSDPYKCSASISHTNDWLVLVPIFFEDELVGWSSQFGHQMDAGGRLPGSLPTGATTIFEEGIIIPPLKIVERGAVQEDVLRLILNNVRLPEMNRADLFAIVAACHAGERRVMELCERFGKDVYLATLQALLDRTHEAMRKLIQLAIPEEPQTFEDWIDDDGLGNGPYKMKLTIWREGEEAWFDWSGTDPQSLGPINFYLSEGMFKMFIGVYLIMVNDPDILFNDGFYPLLHVVMPEGCLLSPRHPAALGCRTHGLARLFDVLGGALTKQAPELNTAAGYGTSPYMLYSGWKDDGEFFYAMEILYGGIPGRPIGDGMDGHSWWPLFENIPTEYLEAYYPLRVDGYTTVID